MRKAHLVRKTVLAMIAAASIPAVTVAWSTQAHAGYRGCWAGAGGAFAGTSYYGRYGKYDYGSCGGYGYGDPPAYYPPAYYEYEPAYDGHPGPVYNPNAYYDYPAYRRVEYREYYGPRRAYPPRCCRPY